MSTSTKITYNPFIFDLRGVKRKGRAMIHYINTDPRLTELYYRAKDEVKGIDEALRHYFAWRSENDLEVIRSRRARLVQLIKAYEVKVFGRIVYRG